ncbi:dual specificity mitogen-activated protein kinase kinase 6-like [Styela clava]
MASAGHGSGDPGRMPSYTPSSSKPGSGQKKKRHKPKLTPFVISNTPQQPPPTAQAINKLDAQSVMKIEGQEIKIRADDLITIEELGRGAYGVVEKMQHRHTGVIMAVKRIRATVNNKEQERLLMDLEVAMRSVDCPYTITFFGALFREGDVWICMEVMDTSLDKFYKKVKDRGLSINENALGIIAVSIVKALRYLQETLRVIHRDVKPSNVLLNKSGEVKLCDFGISGQLVDSLAKTMDAGCKPYMGPERIKPDDNKKGYDVKSDVWSLGITMIEVATGDFPYDTWRTPFQQLKQVVDDPSPSLPANGFSDELCDFCRCCLHKNPNDRHGYPELECHPFIVQYSHESKTNISSFIKLILD